MVCAQTATILPVGFDAGSDGIEGEIVGTGVLPGGVAGTTYILSGVESGVPFTRALHLSSLHSQQYAEFPMHR